MPQQPPLPDAGEGGGEEGIQGEGGEGLTWVKG
jgi:hypothetical protein